MSLRRDTSNAQRFVVDTYRQVAVVHELVHGQHGIIRLDDRLGHFGGRKDGERRHHAVRVFLCNHVKTAFARHGWRPYLSELGKQESTETGATTTAERVYDLEALQSIAGFTLLADNVLQCVQRTRPWRSPVNDSPEYYQ